MPPREYREERPASPRSDELAQHDERPLNPYQTVLPGYGKEYFEGLLPGPTISEKIFASMGTPAYNWRQLEDMKTEKPKLNTMWEPLDPTSMYVSCLSWVAYPYGIPAEDQPCPYYRDIRRDVESSKSSTSGSVSSMADKASELSDSRLQASMSTAPHAQMYQHYAWTGN